MQSLKLFRFVTNYLNFTSSRLTIESPTALIKNCVNKCAKDALKLKKKVLFDSLKAKLSYNQVFGEGNKLNCYKLKTFIAGGCLSLKKKLQGDNNRSSSNVETVPDEEKELLSQEEEVPASMDEDGPVLENPAEILPKMKPDAKQKQTSEPVTVAPITDSLPSTSPIRTNETVNEFSPLTTTRKHKENDFSGVIGSHDGREALLLVEKQSENKQTIAETSQSVDLKDKDTRDTAKRPVGISKRKEEIKTKSRKKRKADTNTDALDEGSGQKMDRPNYFVGIQVTDPLVHANLKKVQDQITEGEKNLKPALVSIATLHLTLLVFRIENDEDLERATETLEKCYDKVKRDFSENPLLVEFQGLGDFKNRVLFAKIRSDETVRRLSELADMLAIAFEETGLSLAGNMDFKPHLTILKLSKAPELRRKGVKIIRKNLYETFADNFFGSDSVKSLQLLSMSKPKTEDGYYHCDKEFHFDIAGHCALSSTEEAASSSSSCKRTVTKEEIRRKVFDLTKEQLNNMEKEKN